LLRILVATSCLAFSSSGLARSLTDNCTAPPVQIAVDCLQPQLDIRIAQAEDLFAEILSSVSRQSLETPEAKIDSARVVMSSAWQESIGESSPRMSVQPLASSSALAPTRTALSSPA